MNLIAAAVTAPTLIIDVSKEELFDHKANGRAVFEIIEGNTEVKYKTYQGKHYDIYDRHHQAASTLALEWFKVHLMVRGPRALHHRGSAGAAGQLMEDELGIETSFRH